MSEPICTKEVAPIVNKQTEQNYTLKSIEAYDKLIKVLEDYAKEKGYKVAPYEETEEGKAENRELFNHFKSALTDLKIKNIRKAKDNLITKEEYLKKTYTIEESFKGLAEIEKEIEE